MASTLNPSAPIWLPANRFNNDNATKVSAPSTPSTTLYSAPRLFVPNQSWPHHEINPFNPFQTYFKQDPYAIQAQPYFTQDPYTLAPQPFFYPPAPYQDWPADHAYDAYGFIDPQDPFARQMRQVENVKAEGNHRAWGVQGCGDGEGAWGAAGKNSYKNKRNKKFRKGRRVGGGWVGREEWRETEKRGEWKTEEEWCSGGGGDKVWDERTDREARKDSGVDVEAGGDQKEGGEA